MLHYPYPAVGVFIFHQDGLFLVKKKRGIFEGLWCTPGGKIEYGEEILDTVMREVKEETNLYINNIKFITFEQTIEKTSCGTVNRHYVFFNFAASLNHQYSINPIAADDAVEIKLFPFTSLRSLNVSDPTIRTLKYMGVL